MSSLVTHLAAGGVYGGLALLVAGRGSPVFSRWWRPVAVVLALAAAGVAADLDLWFGAHRETLHNVWVLFALPALLAAGLLMVRPVRLGWLREAVVFAPAATVSHLWFDMFSPSLHGRTHYLYPVDGQGYMRPQADVQYVAAKPMYDAGATLILLCAWYAVLAISYRAAVLRIDGPHQARWRSVAAAAHLGLALLPVGLLVAMGLVVPM